MNKQYNFNPWDDFEKDPEILPIEDPPCKYCKHWRPQRIYREDILGSVFDGVRLCWSDNDPEHDFSCFKSKEIKND